MYQSIFYTTYKFMSNFILNIDYANILNNMIDVFTDKYVLFFLSYVFMYYFGRMYSKIEYVYIEKNTDNKFFHNNRKNYNLYKKYENKYLSLKKNISEQIETEKIIIESKLNKELDDLKRANRNLSRVNKKYFNENIELSKKVYKNTKVLFHTISGRKLHHKKSCTCLNDIECYNLKIEEKVYNFMERCGIFCKSCI